MSKSSKKIVISISLALCISYSSLSVGLSSEKLYNFCVQKNDKEMSIEYEIKSNMNTAFCYGYFDGVIDGYVIAKYMNDSDCEKNSSCVKSTLVCLPKNGVELGAVVAAYLKFYEQNEIIKKTTARSAILITLRHLYPCPKSSLNKVDSK